MDCKLPDSSVHGILQVRILEWVAISSPERLPDPGIEPVSLMSPALAGRFFTPTPHRKPTIINTALSVDSSEPGTGDLDLPSKGCV